MTVIISVIPSFLVTLYLLGLDFAILFDMHMVIGLEDTDFVIRKFDPANPSERYSRQQRVLIRT